MNLRTIINSAALFSTIVSAAGCASGDKANGATPPGEGPAQRGDADSPRSGEGQNSESTEQPEKISKIPMASYLPAQLPKQGGDASCDAAVTAELGACDYAARNDIIIVATLVEITPVTTPFVEVNLPEKSLQLTGECEAWADPSLRVEVEVKATLFGETITALSRLEFSVGHADLELWAPRPTLLNGSLGWGEEPAKESSPLRPGSVLVVGLKRESFTGGWSLLGEQLYTIGVSGELIGPSRGDFCSPVLEGYTGSGGAEAFAYDLAACSPTDLAAPSTEPGIAEKTRRGEDALWSIAASCLTAEDQAGACSYDLDCDDGEVCVAGVCTLQN